MGVRSVEALVFAGNDGVFDAGIPCERRFAGSRPLRNAKGRGVLSFAMVSRRVEGNFDGGPGCGWAFGRMNRWCLRGMTGCSMRASPASGASLARVPFAKRKGGAFSVLQWSHAGESGISMAVRVVDGHSVG